MDNHQRFGYLLKLYQDGKLSNAEHDDFFDMLSSGDHDAVLLTVLKDEWTQGEIEGEANLPHHVAQDIIRDIMLSEKKTEQLFSRNKGTPFAGIWKWSAAAAIFIGLAYAFYFFSFRKNLADTKTLAEASPSGYIKKVNNTAGPLQIFLPDSSTVVLKPGSAIRFPRIFPDDRRAVFLEGNGFFSVKKNPGKAFWVYYNEIVTRVLGTTFNVGRDTVSGKAEVQVMTGKVQVYGNRKLGGKSVIITPNQKAIYDNEKSQFEIGLVDNPRPIVNAGKNDSLKKKIRIYEQEKISAVLNELQQQYGIEIITANDAINNCEFSGDLSMNDLFVKLRIICLVTNSGYEVNGTKILITGKGCN